MGRSRSWACRDEALAWQARRGFFGTAAQAAGTAEPQELLPAPLPLPRAVWAERGWLGSTLRLAGRSSAPAKELLFPFLLRSLQGFLAL